MFESPRYYRRSLLPSVGFHHHTLRFIDIDRGREVLEKLSRDEQIPQETSRNKVRIRWITGVNQASEFMKKAADNQNNQPGRVSHYLSQSAAVNQNNQPERVIVSVNHEYLTRTTAVGRGRLFWLTTGD